MVVSQSKGLGLHSKYSEKALQCSHRGVAWPDFCFCSVEAGWEESKSGCWRSLRRLLQESRKRGQSPTWRQQERVTNRLPSVCLSFPLFFVQKKTSPWSKLRIRNGAREMRGLQQGNRREKQLLWQRKRWALCDHVTLGLGSSSQGQSQTGQTSSQNKTASDFLLCKSEQCQQLQKRKDLTLKIFYHIQNTAINHLNG